MLSRYGQYRKARNMFVRQDLHGHSAGLQVQFSTKSSQNHRETLYHRPMHLINNLYGQPSELTLPQQPQRREDGEIVLSKYLCNCTATHSTVILSQQSISCRTENNIYAHRTPLSLQEKSYCWLSGKLVKIYAHRTPVKIF